MTWCDAMVWMWTITQSKKNTYPKEIISCQFSILNAIKWSSIDLFNSIKSKRNKANDHAKNKQAAVLYKKWSTKNWTNRNKKRKMAQNVTIAWKMCFFSSHATYSIHKYIIDYIKYKSIMAYFLCLQII